MFQRKLKSLSGNKVLFNRRGQASLLFALLMPIFILMLGVVLDLGWYYLNVSRLQNAADAAAVAGAQTLVSKEGFTSYKSISLVGKYPGKDSNIYRVNDEDEQKKNAITDANSVAEQYVDKNLSRGDNSSIDSWTKAEFQSEQGLYENDDNLYYVVKLQEEIRHFFLPGWFDDMPAPVTAIALLSNSSTKNKKPDNEVDPNNQGDGSGSNSGDGSGSNSGDGSSSNSGDGDPSMPEMPSTSYYENIEGIVVNKNHQKVIEKVLNENMIVGNWEVQAYYRGNNKFSSYYKVNEETGEETPLTEFEHRFQHSFYTKFWNHFQDVKNHYNIAGATYRTETINIWDDVEDTNNDGVADTWGDGKSGMSNVVATAASSNTNKTAAGKGKPYLGYELYSINIDFKPEITFSKITNEDWDFEFGYLTTTCQHQGSDYKDWTASQGSDVKNIGILRIHSTINIGAPYKERTDKTYLETDEKGNLLPDILWGRIESEPMLFYPDEVNGVKTTNMSAKMGLSSVRQIIINVKESNYNVGDNKYRPVILFYDGPETYDIYATAEKDKKHIRDSQPVILNLNAGFRGVLYAPNSPVVVIGNNTGNFDGFVVAKEYKRLKTTEDFETELANDSGKYTRYEGDGKIIFTENEKVDNPYYVADNGNYAGGYVAEPATIKWKYTKITENGIEMYVDNYGNVQYMDYPDAPKKYGTYDNFGRTDFSTHGYKVLKSSANNMLLSNE